ncbi:TnsA endonuclease N-terminal domain-containing protein [Catenibacterium mitsuokai]|uniref:TnsA endonuclease N-terminal domain-containing protein n=1 Tax=Catenibacterium mitsuokai TaxID=100886 RepID=UPI003F929315
MAKKSSMAFIEDFAFYEQLWWYYTSNRGKIRSRYNDLTKKFLSYNDKKENPEAFLRTPQFEALEMYVFIKEFMNNAHMFEMFDDWRKRKDKFADASYYSIHKHGQGSFMDIGDEQNEIIFKQMKKYKEAYPNYIYALTMGLGKTILMGTCIFYEFLLANKYPKDKRFCHNALVFAPDKTVLESLREIMTFDKTKVVPPEYARVLDANIKFHYLDESGTTLQTIDDSDFNIIISNNQKIIVKKKRKKDKPADVLFAGDSLLADIYGDNDDCVGWDDTTLMDNQRFKKLCRLPQLGVYVDEAHHLFGANLEKELRSGGANKTTLRNTINMLAEATSIVACYNYTGTPYVKKQVLPEVVYAYGLNESIRNGFLKDADLIGFDNVKNEEFLKKSITMFWDRYGGKIYEGLPPKMAIFAASVAEATDVVRPIVEKVLSELDVPLDTILVNTGDTTVTKNDDIRNFNNLDVLGTEGSNKQFIILVEKGREGWNCRSLLSIALFRSPKSKIFVLQATMRCLRKLTDEQLKATVFLSKENLETLDAELRNNYNMEINDLGRTSEKKKNTYKVRVLPPPRIIKMKRVWHEYSLIEKEYEEPVNFKLSEIDETKYQSKMYEKGSIRLDMTAKETVIDDIEEQMRYSKFSLVGEISRYMNLPCLKINHILEESVDGFDVIVDAVNRHNEILDDVIIPIVFHTLYEVKSEQKNEDVDVVLLKEPKDAGYYEFSAEDNLVIEKEHNNFTDAEIAKSFHADTYCFDSKPEKECFLQYISNQNVKEVYFTGMFTSNQGDLFVQYYDPESKRIRKYYPDFLAKMADGSYQLIEVKADNRIDDEVVKAKAEAAEEMSVASGMRYIMYAANDLMKRNVLESTTDSVKNSLFDSKN